MREDSDRCVAERLRLKSASSTLDCLRGFKAVGKKEEGNAVVSVDLHVPVPRLLKILISHLTLESASG
jgi:hypothetical protein